MHAATAFVFPGQGSQSVGMLADLAARHESIRACFDEASEGAGIDLWVLSRQGPEEQLNRTEFTQPALLAASIALWRLWRAHGGRSPALLAGHSLGEYSALVAADALSLRDAARLVRLRGQYMQQAAPAGTGAMAAVLGAEDALIEAACAEAASLGVVVAANHNAPGQVVIGGETAAVDRALDLLAARGVRKVVKLAVSVPSHTPLMQTASQALARSLRELVWREPKIPVVQNVDAMIHVDLESILDALVRQLHQPVQWSRCVQALAGHGCTTVIECGPGKVLTGLTRRIDRNLDARMLDGVAEFEATLAACPA